MSADPRIRELPSVFQRLERLGNDLSTGRFVGGAAIAEVDIVIGECDPFYHGVIKEALGSIKSRMLAGNMTASAAAATVTSIVEVRKQKDRQIERDEAEQEASYQLAREMYDLINPRPPRISVQETRRLVDVSKQKSLLQSPSWQQRRDKLVNRYKELIDLRRNGGRGPSDMDIYGQQRTLDPYQADKFDRVSDELKKYDPTYPTESYYYYR